MKKENIQKNSVENLDFAKKGSIFAFTRNKMKHERMDHITPFLKYLGADKGRSGLTLQTYRADREHFHAYMQSVDSTLDWSGVDRDVVRGWVAQMMEEQHKPTYVRRRLSALRSFYRYLMQQGEVSRNPAAEVKGPKLGRPLPAFLREDELNRLFDTPGLFEDNPEAQRDRLILLTFYTTGVRLAELVGLDVADVSVSGRQVRVDGKRNKQRLIPFGEELAAQLEHYLTAVRPNLAGADEAALFVGDDGGRISRSYVEQMVHRRLSAVTTLTKKSPHVLRHSFATAMLNHGADIESVRRLLGHASLAATAIYTHVSLADLKEAYLNAHPRA